jgi:hypothetical protein
LRSATARGLRPTFPRSNQSPSYSNNSRSNQRTTRRKNRRAGCVKLRFPAAEPSTFPRRQIASLALDPNNGVDGWIRVHSPIMCRGTVRRVTGTGKLPSAVESSHAVWLPMRRRLARPLWRLPCPMIGLFPPDSRNWKTLPLSERSTHPKKKLAKLRNWRVAIMRARAHNLGTIEAPNQKAARWGFAEGPAAEILPAFSRPSRF